MSRQRRKEFVRESMAKKPVSSIPGLENLDERFLEEDGIFSAADLFVEYLYQEPDDFGGWLHDDWSIPDEDIDNVINVFDDWLEKQNYKQLAWFLKHERFVEERMRGKSVGCIPGIGEAGKRNLQDEGIQFAAHLSAEYRRKGREEFRRWLREDIGICNGYIDRVIFAFDERRRSHGHRRRRTEEFREFVCHSMTGKSVILVPGIGPNCGSSLEEEGIVYASDLFVEYLHLGKDEFVDRLLEDQEDIDIDEVIDAFEERMKEVRLISKNY